jgi:hypothetical protein
VQPTRDVRRRLKRPLGGPAVAGAILGLAEPEEQLAARAPVAWLGRFERVERHSVEPSGLLEGQQREGAIAGAASEAHALLEGASGDGVVCELCQVRPGLGAEDVLERPHRQPVQLQSAGGRQPVVERVADEDVREPQVPRVAGSVSDHPGAHCLVQGAEELVIGHAGHARKRLRGELAPEYRCESQHAAAVLREVADPARDRVADARRDGQATVVGASCSSRVTVRWRRTETPACP